MCGMRAIQLMLHQPPRLSRLSRLSLSISLIPFGSTFYWYCCEFDCKNISGRFNSNVSCNCAIRQEFLRFFCSFSVLTSFQRLRMGMDGMGNVMLQNTHWLISIFSRASFVPIVWNWNSSCFSVSLRFACGVSSNSDVRSSDLHECKRHSKHPHRTRRSTTKYSKSITKYKRQESISIYNFTTTRMAHCCGFKASPSGRGRR